MKMGRGKSVCGVCVVDGEVVEGRLEIRPVPVDGALEPALGAPELAPLAPVPPVVCAFRRVAMAIVPKADNEKRTA